MLKICDCYSYRQQLVTDSDVLCMTLSCMFVLLAAQIVVFVATKSLCLVPKRL